MDASTTTKSAQVHQLIKSRGAVRPRDLVELGLPAFYLHRLWQRGEVERVERGLYRLADGPVSEHHSLVEACLKAPGAVGCLLTALAFHGFTTQCPEAVWVAVGPNAYVPKTALPMESVRMSGQALSAGAEEHQVEGITVRVFSVAKTIADLFKFRRRVGQDVALEALRDGWQRRRFAMDELWRYARIDRVTRVIGPYLEMLT